MIGVALLTLVTANVCPIERASYALRSNSKVTVHFERSPTNDVWQQGLVVAIHGANTGRTTYWLPWYGGTDGGRHIRRTELVDRSKDMEAQRRVERRGDLDFFVLNKVYKFSFYLPKRGGKAPAHLLIPDLDLWHGGPLMGPRDSSPRAFFDLVGCHRSKSNDRGRDAILPPVA